MSTLSSDTNRTIPQVLAARPWLTERYLRRLVYERRIGYSKVGGRILIDLMDVDALVASGRVEPMR